MTELETRLPCPVCLGTRMEKISLAVGDLSVDCCRRCGGIWFEKGEVDQVRHLELQPTLRRLGASADIARAPCHGCRAPVARNQESCPVCGRHASVACPACHETMTATRLQSLRLDVCAHCRGVWFDRHEVAEIWSGRVRDALARRRRNHAPGDADGLLLLDAFVWSPDLVFLGAHAAGEVAGSVGGLLTEAGGAVGGAAQIAGEAAAGVFETIAGIIGGLFS